MHSSSDSARHRRPAGKLDTIVRRLRAEILSGKLPAGGQLPPQATMARQCGVSIVTMQAVLGRLTREGFVHARARQGTFVTAKLPHLTNYALVFWNDPREPSQWSKYYSALTSAAAEIQRTEGRQITFFHGINQHVDSEDRQRLLDMMQANRLAGMIFANSPVALVGSPLLEAPGIPRVAIMGEQRYPQVPVLTLGGERLLTRALDYLVAQGRSRIAILNIEVNEEQDRELTRMLTSRGLAVPARWRQSLSRINPFSARHCVELLLQGPAADRPDGLIIRDDNLIEYALAGIVAAGVKVPDELEVVVHCNFPWPTGSVLPVQRLGINVCEVLRHAIEIIDRQRRGEPVAGVNLIPAVFEEELTTTAPGEHPVTTQPAASEMTAV